MKAGFESSPASSTMRKSLRIRASAFLRIASDLRYAVPGVADAVRIHCLRMALRPNRGYGRHFDARA
jgi:hypothetical protein